MEHGLGIHGLDRLLELKSGKRISGLLLREQGEVYVMADAQGKEVRVPKNTVDEKQVLPSSPMPANFADQIAEEDFNHLMAFLLAQSAKAEAPGPK